MPGDMADEAPELGESAGGGGIAGTSNGSGTSRRSVVSEAGLRIPPEDPMDPISRNSTAEPLLRNDGTRALSHGIGFADGRRCGDSLSADEPRDVRRKSPLVLVAIFSFESRRCIARGALRGPRRGGPCTSGRLDIDGDSPSWNLVCRCIASGALA